MLVEHYISTRQSPQLSDIGSEERLHEQGFSKQQFCIQPENLCVSYLVSAPLATAQTLSYEVGIDTGGRTDRVRLDLDRHGGAAPFHGTVLLLHGFRASKEFMTNTALYFRFLGFSVLIPDLLGSGESGGALSFGIRDSRTLSRLLDSRPETSAPLYVLGDSMGTLAAAHLALIRTDVRGLILQAPISVFDRTVVSYIKNYSPRLAWCLTEPAMREGAMRSLARAGVSLAQTDIKPILNSLSIPVLILASSEDPVAPFDEYRSLAGQTVFVARVEKRGHAGVAVIGGAEAEVIERWLMTVSGSPE
jgi:pimeloyl-ACP methyl ester carboxylesterase